MEKDQEGLGLVGCLPVARKRSDAIVSAIDERIPQTHTDLTEIARSDRGRARSSRKVG